MFLLVHFGEMTRLFYDVSYKNGGITEPSDLLAELIAKNKIIEERKTDDQVSVETLQFSTCYKGTCVHIIITKNEDYHK